MFKFLQILSVVSKNLSVNSTEKPSNFLYLNFFKTIATFSTDYTEYNHIFNRQI